MKTASYLAAAQPSARPADTPPWAFTIQPRWRSWLAQAWRDAMEAWALVERSRNPWGWS